MAKRILIVEDDLLNRMFLSATLEGHGFTVASLEDGRKAVEKARQFRPDLVITDIQLPHVSGLKVIAALREDPAMHDIPILAVTAYVGPGEERRIRKAGASDFLPKPVSIQPLMKAVNQLTGAAEAPSPTGAG